MTMQQAAVVTTAREKTLKALDKLPTLSPMMTQLMAKLARRNCETAELAALIEKDTILTAQVLKLANSALFGRKQPVIAIRHAIPLIGMGTMRKFVLGSSISNLFSRSHAARSFSMTRFNLHSVATATLAELVCDEVPVENPEAAFVAGLLHDVGTLMIAVNMPHQFEDILAMTAVSHESVMDCERQALGLTHAEISELVITRWALAEPIRRAARYHHAPEEADGEPRAPGKMPLGLLIHKADEFIDSIGMAVVPRAINPEETPKLEFPGFKFSSERTLKRFEQEWKALGDMFG